MTANDWERMDGRNELQICDDRLFLSRSCLFLSRVALGVVAKALNRAHECNGNSLKASSLLSLLLHQIAGSQAQTLSQHARGGGRILSV